MKPGWKTRTGIFTHPPSKDEKRDRDLTINSACIAYPTHLRGGGEKGGEKKS